MHYFTINTEDNEHIGFLIMLPDDAGEHDAPHGQFAIKQADDVAMADVLAQWADNTELRWAVQGDEVQLYDEQGEYIGRIRQQYLQLGKYHFLLNDLTGMM